MATPIAALLSQLLEKEYERKKLGGEILSLYREINLIYNFSEQLSSSAGMPPIAQLALEKASRVIDFQSGRVVFRSEPGASVQILAQMGNTSSLPDWENLPLNDRPGIHVAGNEEEYILYAPLQIDPQSFGAVILLVNTPNERTAARLKLLNTIARQVASAIRVVRQDEKQRISNHEGNPSSDGLIQTLEHILEENLSNESFALPELCRSIGMSRSQLFRKMKVLINESPSAFIRNFRLNRARKLLEKTDLMVSEIAYLVGYSNPAYFSYSFNEAFGISPSSIRTAKSPI